MPVSHCVACEEVISYTSLTRSWYHDSTLKAEGKDGHLAAIAGTAPKKPISYRTLAPITSLTTTGPTNLIAAPRSLLANAAILGIGVVGLLILILSYTIQVQ